MVWHDMTPRARTHTHTHTHTHTQPVAYLEVTHNVGAALRVGQGNPGGDRVVGLAVDVLEVQRKLAKETVAEHRVGVVAGNVDLMRDRKGGLRQMWSQWRYRRT